MQVAHVRPARLGEAIDVILRRLSTLHIRSSCARCPGPVTTVPDVAESAASGIL
jgi:hypothetical protein